MRDRKLTDEAHTTHVDLSPLVPVLLLALAGLFALVTAAALENKTAQMILVGLTVAACITLGVILANSIRRSNTQARNVEMEMKQEAWRLTQEENMILFQNQARGAAELGLATQRTVKAALTATTDEPGDEDIIEGITVPRDMFNDL